MKFTTKVQQYNDTQDLFLEIPHYILQNLNWEEGDDLAWSISQGKIILTKVKDASESQEESGEINDWYTVKGEAIKEHIEDLTEHFFQDYDEEFWEDYNNNTKEKKNPAIETFGQKYYSPEAQGHW